MHDLDSLEPSQEAYRQSGYRKADITMLLTDSEKTNFVEGLDHLAIPGSICTPRATAIIRVSYHNLKRELNDFFKIEFG